ncbi:hypothetical protein BDV98DRAFT_478149, partial [Pterulicium gracile]
GHHLPLRNRLAELQSRILDGCDPTASGVDPAICILPRRLHLTLGPISRSPYASQRNKAKLTIPTVVSHLESIRGKIIELLNGEPLMVPLERMDIMHPRTGSLEDAGVLWLGPDLRKGEEERKRETKVLERVTDFIHRSFKDAGYLVDTRPLKLHATFINTVYRKGKGKRRPFSYTQVLDALGLKDEVLPTRIPPPAPPGKISDVASVPMDLGMWRAEEVQICRLGSWGPENEYVSVGGVKL